MGNNALWRNKMLDLHQQELDAIFASSSLETFEEVSQEELDAIVLAEAWPYM